MGLHFVKRYFSLSRKYITESFIAYCRKKPTAFTRKRKMPITDLIPAILQEHGISSYMETYNYYQKKGVKMTISATAMKNQRMNLIPEAFLELNRHYLKEFYAEEEELKTFHGYILIGIDGTDLILPTTETLMEVFGYTYGKEEDKKTAMATMSTSRDLMNHMTLDCIVDQYRTPERIMMRLHLLKAPEALGSKKKISVMDRGYYSAREVAFFKTITRSHFVFRIKSNVLEIQKKRMKSEDEIIKLVYTKKMIEEETDEEIKEYMRKKQIEHVRLTKILLNTGEWEYLLSDLEIKKFSIEELSEIYHMRWEIETSYNNLKNQMRLENFSGKTEELIKQDVYSSVLASNMIQDMVRECTREINEGKKYKYEMQVNRNIATGMWKERIVKVIAIEDQEEGEKEYMALKEEVKQHIVPIRPGRSNIRKKIKKPRKSHQNKKTAY